MFDKRYNTWSEQSEWDLRGYHADRPAPNTVRPGTTYWSIDEPAEPGTIFFSNGTDWVVFLEF